MRASEWEKEIGTGFLAFQHFTKVFVLCENMKDFLQNVEKEDYRIIKYNPPGYIIELTWSGKGTDKEWYIPYQNVSNICERIVK